MKDKKISHDLIYVINRYKLENGKVLDLGCGRGQDPKYLLEKGFEVTAIDKAKRIGDDFTAHPNFHFHKALIEEFPFGKYDLINAQWVFPFIKNDHFEDVIFKCKKALNKNGFLIAQFLGYEDEWKKHGKDLNYSKKATLLEHLDGMELMKFSEVKLQGFTYNKKPKFWHYFEVIALKK